MRDENRPMTVDVSQRRKLHWRPTLLGVLALLAAGLIAAPALAQRPDDSYKGPSQGGGLDEQLRGVEPPPAAPGGGGGGGGVSNGGGGAGGGGLQGRQTQGT